MITSENTMLRKSLSEKDIALKYSEEKFKAYQMSKESQIALMKSDNWKSNAKAFGLGFGCGLGVGLSLKLRFQEGTSILLQGDEMLWNFQS